MHIEYETQQNQLRYQAASPTVSVNAAKHVRGLRS